jgi:LmbE family N-acetylglucosaminyl deacetylase
MLPLDLAGARRLLVLGAHCDDVDIGCGGTLLHLCEQHRDLEVKWVTFSGNAARKAETEAAAGAFLQAASAKSIEVYDFKDGFFPWEGAKVKERFEEIASGFRPDVVLTHRRDDRHQDHRLVAELAWNTFRDQVVLEYEIPKWEGDLGQPNLYVPLSADVCRRKIAFLMDFYPSQVVRDWYTEDLFWGLLRIRGIECRSPSGFAEAFHGSKLTLRGFGGGEAK